VAQTVVGGTDRSVVDGTDRSTMGGREHTSVFYWIGSL
jgi:hypothetical protein